MSLRAILMAAALWWGVDARAGTESLATEDGVDLSATSTGAGTKGVLLVHEAGRDQSTWGTFADRLSSAGFRVLALDLRGHGASKGAGALGADDYPKMIADVDAGVAWLIDKGADEVMIVGAELGANLALNAASDDARVTNVVLLSPALNAKGVTVSQAIATYGDRPLLLVSSTDDPLSSKAAQLLDDRAAGTHLLETYPKAGVGSRMLNAAPDLENLIVGWLNGSHLTAEDPGAAVRGEIKGSEASDIEARGTRLEDRER